MSNKGILHSWWCNTQSPKLPLHETQHTASIPDMTEPLHTQKWHAMHSTSPTWDDTMQYVHQTHSQRGQHSMGNSLWKNNISSAGKAYKPHNNGLQKTQRSTLWSSEHAKHRVTSQLLLLNTTNLSREQNTKTLQLNYRVSVLYIHIILYTRIWFTCFSFWIFSSKWCLKVSKRNSL